MIRTRDLVLFVITLLILGAAILVTLSKEFHGAVTGLLLTDATTKEYEATRPDTPAMLDREANRARLREKIALDTSTITTDPDTFVDEAVGDEVIVTDAALSLDGTSAVTSCGGDDVLPNLKAWPVAGASLTVRAGTRIVYEQTPSAPLAAEPGATTTPPTPQTQEHIFLALPLQPVSAAHTSCVPSEVVGVTPSGTLIFNSDVAIWKYVNADTQIGFARDGFPIYGMYTGAVDACGGYQSSTGYRYTVSPDRPFILGCYTATPQPITW